MKKIIPYSRQKIDRQDINAVTKVLKSDFITQGPLINKFEKKIARAVKAKFATACNSATSALHISCMALGFKKNDILWTVPNSFVASANCAKQIGGKVDFVDIDTTTFNIDIKLLAKKLKEAKKNNKLPKIIIPVHFAGQPTLQDEIYKLSKKFKFKIIEDASNSLGANYKKIKVGNCKWSDITVFSLHPVKIITSGEGGIATTNNKNIFYKLQMYKNHGITKNKKFFLKKNFPGWHYEQQFLGLNYRMNEISAALGISQLYKLNSYVKDRNRIANYYKKKIDIDDLALPKINSFCLSTFHLFVVRITSKNYKKIQVKLFTFLRKKKILVNVHYIPIHLQPYYKSLGFKKGDFKNSEKHAESTLSLPIYPGLASQELDYIIKQIKLFFRSQ